MEFGLDVAAYAILGISPVLIILSYFLGEPDG